MMQRPQFRTDLVSTPIQQEGQTFVDVTDPNSGKTFRFFEVEYAVACAMDGNRDVAGLVNWAKEELGLSPSTDEVQMVISTLEDLGYVSKGDGSIAPPARVADASAPVAAAGGPDLALDIALGSAGGGSDVATGSQPIVTDDFELGAAGADGKEASLADARNFELDLGAPGAPVAAADPFGGQVRGDSSTEPAPIAASARDSFGPPPGPPTGRRVDPLASTRLPGSMMAPPDTEPPPVGDVSIDLSNHLPVNQSDVRKAVRQSQVMEVAMPPMDQPYRPPSQPLGGAVPLPPRPGSGQPSGATAAPGREPKKSSGALLWVLLFLLVAAAGGAAYYFLVYSKDDGKTIKKPVTTQVDKPKPPAPKPILATLVKGKANELVVAAPKAGVVSWLAEPGKELKAGDDVGRFKGAERKQAALDKATAKLEGAKAELVAATAAGKAQPIRNAQSDVNRYQKRVDKMTKDLAADVVVATGPGIVERKIEPNTRVKAGDDLLTLTSHDGPTATFTVPDGSKYKAGAAVTLQLKGQAELTLPCKVSSVAGPAVEVACEAGAAGFKAGDSVVLEP